jgi:hypothetical protein
MNLNKIIDSDILNKLSKSEKESMTESITTYIESENKKLEVQFESMVDNISNKFDGMVDNAITESVSANMSSGVNKELYTALESIVTVLESTGVYSSEESKKHKAKVLDANKKLQEAYIIRDSAIAAKNKSDVKDYIRNELAGSIDGVIASAIEHFKDKDIETVIDELDDFVNGDYTSIDMSKEDIDGLDEISLDDIEKAMNQVGSNGNKFESTNSRNSIKVKGGKQMTSITTDMLNTPIIESVEGVSGNNTELDDETQDAMNMITNMQGFGYNNSNKI